MKQIRHTDRPPLPLRMLRAAGSPAVGLVMAGLLWAYLAWVSVWTTSAAGILGTTTAGVYRHPILLSLGGLLCASMVGVTLRRIPLGWTTLGAWLAHAGTIVLVLGGAWYGAARLRGDALFVRGPEGFAPVRHAYVDDSAAVYAGLLAEGTLQQTPIAWPPQLDAPKDVDIALAGTPESASLRVVRLLPAVMLEETWTDDAPLPIPAVRVAVSDDRHVTRGLLCNAYDRTTALAGAGWVMTFDGDVHAAELAARSRPGPVAAAHDRITLLQGPSLEPTLLVRRTDGSTTHVAFGATDRATVHATSGELTVRLIERFTRAQPTLRVVPDGHGPKQRAAVVELTVGDHSQRRVLPFTPYPLDEPPQRAWLPDGQSLDLHLGRGAVSLSATVTITDATYHPQPGSVIPRDYVCRLLIDTGDTQHRDTLRLNQPVQLGRYQLNQGSWSPTPHDPTTIRVAVTTRPGLPVIWAGVALLLTGVTWALLVKPLLRRRGRR
jgi:hypothetical protein